MALVFVACTVSFLWQFFVCVSLCFIVCVSPNWQCFLPCLRYWSGCRCDGVADVFLLLSYCSVLLFILGWWLCFFSSLSLCSALLVSLLLLCADDSCVIIFVHDLPVPLECLCCRWCSLVRCCLLLLLSLLLLVSSSWCCCCCCCCYYYCCCYCLFVCLFVYLFVCLFVYLFVFLLCVLSCFFPFFFLSLFLYCVLGPSLAETSHIGADEHREEICQGPRISIHEHLLVLVSAISPLFFLRRPYCPTYELFEHNFRQTKGQGIELPRLCFQFSCELLPFFPCAVFAGGGVRFFLFCDCCFSLKCLTLVWRSRLD